MEDSRLNKFQISLSFLRKLIKFPFRLAPGLTDEIWSNNCKPEEHAIAHVVTKTTRLFALLESSRNDVIALGMGSGDGFVADVNQFPQTSLVSSLPRSPRSRKSIAEPLATSLNSLLAKSCLITSASAGKNQTISHTSWPLASFRMG